jgi:tRNA pseudouridine32 synthase/23S rRNA pseudouridine746 synthase
MAEHTHIPILHRDERIVVVDKPAGLLSVPGIGPDKADCLVARLAVQFPQSPPRIVHRLDRDTSGVMVLAFDADAHRELSRQFQDREVVKHYTAVVAGHLESDAGTIDLPMRKDMDAAPTPLQRIDHERGRRAITHYTVVERATLNPAGFHPRLVDDESRTSHSRGCKPADTMQITHLDLNPVTGRSHQLRLHLKTIGHPILGDDLYAPDLVLSAAPRLMLHARSLFFVHPETAAPMRFNVSAPF